MTVKDALNTAYKLKNASAVDIAIALLEAQREGYKKASEDALRVIQGKNNG